MKAFLPPLSARSPSCACSLGILMSSGLSLFLSSCFLVKGISFFNLIKKAFSFIFRLMDVKQGQNKEGKTVLYLVFEYMDTDLKKYIRSFRQTGENIPVNTVKVSLSDSFIQLFSAFVVSLWIRSKQSHHFFVLYSLMLAIFVNRAWCTNCAKVLPSATVMGFYTGYFKTLAFFFCSIFFTNLLGYSIPI